MLVEIGIGDAYGAGFEFTSREKISNYNKLTSYHGHALGMPAGNYTDDTQMSIAIAELLLSDSVWNENTISNKFVDCFKRDNRVGYSKNFYNILNSVKNGQELLAALKPTSVSNGAAMRSVPIGVLNNINNVLDKAAIQASVTHNTNTGIKSSQAIGLACHFFLYRLGNPSELLEFVSDHTKMNWDHQWNSNVACCGIETVNAILTVLKESTCLSDIVLSSVEFGGDVDTVAACALGIGSTSTYYQNDLPFFLYNELENHMFGKDYLCLLDEKLTAMFM